MATEKKSELLIKIAMSTFFGFIMLFVLLSSFVYFNNSNNVALKIQTDNEVNKEKTAINEILSKTLSIKNDSIMIYKIEVKKKDSVLYKKLEEYEKTLKKVEQVNDSLVMILRNIKQSDIQPINRTKLDKK